MQEMGSQQDSTVDVLRRARQFLKRPPVPLKEQEARDLDAEISFINDKLNSVRDQITNRQTTLYEILMQLQQQRLIQLRDWLTQHEDTLSTIAQPGPDYAATVQQIEVLKKLQMEIHEQQDLVNSLSEMIINVDDPDYADLEDQLMATGERFEMSLMNTSASSRRFSEIHRNDGGRK